MIAWLRTRTIIVTLTGIVSIVAATSCAMAGEQVLFGFINRSGKFVINPQFDYAQQFSDGLAAVRVRGKWGYIDKSGRVVINPKYESPGWFFDGLAPVELGNKVGYIDKTGKLVIPAKFDRHPNASAASFSEGRCPVYVDKNGWGFIDKSGSLVIKPQFGWAFGFHDGLALVLVRPNDKWGYIDKSGNFVIPPKFDYAAQFSEGLAAVEISKKLGFIDKTGRFAIPPKFDSHPSKFYTFSDGLAYVGLGGKIGFIDKVGRFVIRPQFTFPAANFSEGLAPVTFYTKDGSVKGIGYINNKGNVSIKPSFSGADFFSEGLAAVTQDKEYYPCSRGMEGWHRKLLRWGFIDKTGKMVIEAKFVGNPDYMYGVEHYTKFKDGLAPVGIESDSGK